MADEERLEQRLAVEGIDCPEDSSCLEGMERAVQAKVRKETGRGRHRSHSAYHRPALSTDKSGRSNEFSDEKTYCDGPSQPSFAPFSEHTRVRQVQQHPQRLNQQSHSLSTGFGCGIYGDACVRRSWTSLNHVSCFDCDGDGCGFSVGPSSSPDCLVARNNPQQEYDRRQGRGRTLSIADQAQGRKHGQADSASVHGTWNENGSDGARQTCRPCSPCASRTERPPRRYQGQPQRWGHRCGNGCASGVCPFWIETCFGRVEQDPRPLRLLDMPWPCYYSAASLCHQMKNGSWNGDGAIGCDLRVLFHLRPFSFQNASLPKQPRQQSRPHQDQDPQESSRGIETRRKTKTANGACGSDGSDVCGGVYLYPQTLFVADSCSDVCSWHDSCCDGEILRPQPTHRQHQHQRLCQSGTMCWAIHALSSSSDGGSAQRRQLQRAHPRRDVFDSEDLLRSRRCCGHGVFGPVQSTICEGCRRGRCARSTLHVDVLRRILGCASSRCSHRQCGKPYSDRLRRSGGLSGTQRHHGAMIDASSRRLSTVSMRCLARNRRGMLTVIIFVVIAVVNGVAPHSVTRV